MEKKVYKALSAAAATVFWSAICLGNPAAASGPVHQPEEENQQQFLFMADDAYTQLSRQWQISFSTGFFSRQKSKEVETEDSETEVTRTRTNQWLWNTEIEYGLTDWLELEFELLYSHIHRRTIETEDDSTSVSRLYRTGLSDIQAGISARIAEEDKDLWWAPAVKAAFGITLPTGNWRKDMGYDHYGWETGLLLSRTFEKWAYHLNGFYGRTDNARQAGETERADIEAFETAAAVVYMPSEKLDLICELSAEFEKEKNSSGKSHEQEIYLSGGFKTELFEDFDIGLAVPVGLTGDSFGWGVIFKVQYEWQ